ncbi:MAG: UbiD family decarboxylase [Candidatus Aenigmarchaeota archaeon]|nr:UbiD family decarboxylase [Candidatus Aenigmarchaeota archaeon]
MNFRDTIKRIDGEGKLIRIKKPVSTKYQIPAIIKHYDGKNTVYFENVIRPDSIVLYNIPVVANLLGSNDLFFNGIGIKMEEWNQRMNYYFNNLGQRKLVKNNFKYQRPDLDDIPILTHFEKDGGPYIASALIMAEYKGKKNVSFHRMMKIDKNKLVARIVHRDLHRMMEEAKEDFPVAVCIGNRPSVLVAGATSKGYDIDELEIASAIERRPIEVVKGKNKIEYPADTEIVLEGRFLYNKEKNDWERATEGPFVDLTEKYDVTRMEPIIEIDRIATQKHIFPIYHALLPSLTEHKLLMGMPRTPTIYSSLTEGRIEVEKIYPTPEGSGWLDIVVSIDKKTDEDGKKAIEAVKKGHPSAKRITIVDKDVDVTNINEVQRAVVMYGYGIEREPHVSSNVKISTLDPMASPDGKGRKLCIDATIPLGISETEKGKFERAKIPFDLNIDDYL